MIVLAILFLFSGFSALVYQVVWLRMLALVFGVTTYAASAVLSSFMGGLALGSWLGGRIADRVRNPLRAFAYVELGIAASALTVPAVLDLAHRLYAAAHAAAPDALPLLTLARLLCSGLVLLVPTTLMGASLPILSRFVAQSDGAAAPRIAVLYAVNTTGAILGTVLAGFFLIGAIGIAATTWIAAAINGAVGLSALVLARGRAFAPAPLGEAPLAHTASSVSALQRRVLFLAALAGFAGLALEVVWFRILVLFIPATVYAFTTMLAVVLLGIALGSAIASRWLRSGRHPLHVLATVQVATGVMVILSMAGLAFTYQLGWRTSGMIQACVVAMLPATMLMGATFPLALALWLDGSNTKVGQRVGVLYAANVCGAVAGALAGGFLLLPLLGSRASLLALAAVYALAGSILMTAKGLRPALVHAAVAAALITSVSLMLPDLHSAVLARRHGRTERIVFRSEGHQSTATVHVGASGQKTLYLDGLHQANDSDGMVRLHAEIGHLAMLLHHAPRRSLVVGLGGGATAGAVSVHDTNLDVVELSRSVVEAAAYFSHVNFDLLNRPNVRLRTDDGRNHLLLTHERYDVVTADIIQPIHAGAGNLYSREYFTLVANVLRDDGLVLQWIGHRDDGHYRLIMRTFLDVFPHATLWSGGTLMVGTKDPLRISRAAIERQLAGAGTRAALSRVGLDSFDAVLARYTAGADEMRAFVGPGPILTDDRPLLEYHRSLDGTGKPLDLSPLKGDVTRHLAAAAQ